MLGDITTDSPPLALAVNPKTDMIFVANSGDNTVSVIDPSNNTKVARIPVGNSPSAIGFDPKTDKIFVANSGSNTVSEIDGKNYKKIHNIPVGEAPSSIAVNSNMSLIYVANKLSKSISIINEKTNKQMEQGTFSINPSNSGRIRCNGIEILTSVYIGLDVDTGCEAIANNGYQFTSWSEKLDHNSTRTLTASTMPNSPFSFFLKDLMSDLGFGSRDNSTLNVFRDGNFTANFKQAPPVIPPEYLLTLFGIMIGTFAPSIVRWVNGWRQRRNLRNLIKRIDSGEEPNKLEAKILQFYTKGKISDSHYALLIKKLSKAPGGREANREEKK